MMQVDCICIAIVTVALRVYDEWNIQLEKQPPQQVFFSVNHEQSRGSKCAHRTRILSPFLTWMPSVPRTPSTTPCQSLRSTDHRPERHQSRSL